MFKGGFQPVDTFDTKCTTESYLDVNAKIACYLHTRSNSPTDIKVDYNISIERKHNSEGKVGLYSGSLLLADLNNQPLNRNYSSRYYLLPSTEFVTNCVVKDIRLIGTEKGKIEIMVRFIFHILHIREEVYYHKYF